MGKILDQINKEHLVLRFLSLLIGTFVATFIYNKFLVTNNIIVGGISGLAIVVKQLFGIDTTLFINGSNVILIILSFIMLGKKKTFEQLVGCIMYLLMLNFTAPIAKLVNFSFNNSILMVLFVALILGCANGIIYRAGYSTGGSDFLSQILSFKIKKSITQISLVFQIFVIIFGAIVFSGKEIMLSIMMIYISNKITNAVLFGVSTSKLIYVISSKNDEIEKCVLEKFKNGTTEVKVHGGIFEKKNNMLLCVVHNAQYNKFKEAILTIDEKAFLVSNKCYEVKGGIKFNILPF